MDAAAVEKGCNLVQVISDMGKLSCKISQFCNVGNDVVMNVKFLGYGLFPYINGNGIASLFSRTRNQCIRKSYKKPNPLAKHIVCICGRALCWHKDKKTGEELFYCRYCRAHKENGKNLKVPAATIYKKVMDALELEHLEKEKLAAAIQQGAGRKAIEVVRAEKSVQMKSVLAELNMEQFRRVPLYESYIADEITEEQYRAELLDYEEAHRKLNEQLTTIMEDTLVWERALSLRNPWIQQMAQYKTPEELDRNFVKKYIEQVTVTLRDDGQAEISLTMKTDEWKQMLSRIEVEGTDSGTKE